MKDHPLNLGLATLFVDVEGFEQMPGDRLPFAVEVGGEDQAVALFDLLLEHVEMFLAVGQDLVLGVEAALDID